MESNNTQQQALDINDSKLENFYNFDEFNNT